MSSDLAEVRQFHLTGYIDVDKASEFTTDLQLADESDPDAFWKIIIHSDGGDIEAGSAVYDLLRNYSERGDGTHYITTHMLGQCCSMATLVSQAGDWRTTTNLTFWMFHDLTTCMTDRTTKDIREQCDMYDEWAEEADRLMLERTNLSFEAFRENVDGRDWWLRGKVLQELGFVDEIS